VWLTRIITIAIVTAAHLQQLPHALQPVCHQLPPVGQQRWTPCRNLSCKLIPSTQQLRQAIEALNHTICRSLKQLWLDGQHRVDRRSTKRFLQLPNPRTDDIWVELPHSAATQHRHDCRKAELCVF
jgi:hypothetical protein